MRIETVDQFSADFDEFALRSSDATFYHTGTWIESLAHAFPSMRFQSLVARSASEVVGYLPFFILSKGPLRAAWSLPFGTYGGPVSGGDEEVRRALLGAYAELRKRRGICEVGLVDFSNRVVVGPFRVEEAVTHVIELEGGFEGVWNRAFEKSKRRQTRKALKEGLTVAETGSPEDLSRYYDIYVDRVREWNERLRYPEALFAELFSRRKERVKLFVAKLGGELLGGHLNFYFGDTVIAWNGVTRDTSDGTQASTLLYSECVRHACENGFRRYNLGSSLGKQSLVGYKESLGGVPCRYRTVRWRSATGKVVGTIRSFVSRR